MRPDRVSEDSWPSSFLASDEVAFLQTTKLDRKTPFLIQGVRNTQLSIARFYGGITYNGRTYDYLPETDELIREDVAKEIMKRREKLKRTVERAEDAKQTDMFKKPRSARKRRPSTATHKEDDAHG